MISVAGLDKTFVAGRKRIHTLRAVDFELAAGEFLVVIGASGSGKTTLLRAVAGLERPEGGVIRLRDRIVFDAAGGIDLEPQARNLGMVFQSYAIWPHLTVLQNVMLPLRRGHKRLGRAEARRAALEALALVGIAGLAEQPAPLLSGGQQQRVALARAMAVSSDVLLMDEPLSNLDAQLREEVRRELKALASRLGATVLYVTHDRAEAIALADRLLVLDQGAVMQVGPPSEIYSRPATRKLADFLGHVNWLEGKVMGEGRVETKLGALRTASSARGGGAVTVGIRPEGILLRAASPGRDAAAPNTVTATAVSVQYLGSFALVEVETAGERLLAEWRGAPLPEPGAQLLMQFPVEQLLVFDRAAAEEPLPESASAQSV